MENKLRYIVKKHCLKNKINDFSVIEQKQNEIISKYNSNQINFKDKISYTLYTTNKKRKLAIVEDGSVEYFVITLLNKIVQNKIKPHFKSRNRVILELFDNLNSNAASEVLKNIVSNIMAEDPITVSQTERIGDICALFAEKNIGGVPVTKDDEIIGIITEKDILNAIKTL